MLARIAAAATPLALLACFTDYLHYATCGAIQVVGFCSSAVSDTISNSIRVIKVAAALLADLRGARACAAAPDSCPLARLPLPCAICRL